jgi:hypothetical protein
MRLSSHLRPPLYVAVVALGLLVLGRSEAQDPVPSYGGSGTATLDGVFSPGEWDGADSITFDANLPQADGGGTTPAELLIMNDGNTLYFGVRVARSSYGGATNPTFEFDNNNNNALDDGEDAYGMSVGIFSDPAGLDAFRRYDAGSGLWTGPSDESDGGTNDVFTDATNDGTYTYIEIAHPLDSGDTGHDFSLVPGNVVGFTFALRLFALDPGEDDYADTYVISTNPVNYADLVITGATAPSVSFSFGAVACGDSIPWVQDKLLTFPVTADDPDVGDVVTIEAFEVVPGTPAQYVALASLTPVVPPSAPHAAESVFAWTPTGDDTGDRVLAFVATDQAGLQDECRLTVRVDLDSDEDGLPDVWETEGYTAPNGEFVPLHEMGADPLHKDVFVDIDYMVGETTNLAGTTYVFDHRPVCAALDEIKAAFAAAPVDNPDGETGITLHVRVAQLACDDAAVTSQLPFVPVLGSLDDDEEYLWVAPEGDATPHFMDLRNAAFPEELGYAVHYCVFAHKIATNQTGISRGNGAGDFIVSLGTLMDVASYAQDLPAGSTVQAPAEAQAGTFMHELGHNLGLDHGGGDGLRQKPNYLSVMNKDFFQMTGLIIDGVTGEIGGDLGMGASRRYHFDYSREALPGWAGNILDEDDLDENVGLQGSDAMARYGTFYYSSGTEVQVDNVNASIDWDIYDEATSSSVSMDVSNLNGIEDLLGHDDWGHLVFTGGVVGGGVEIPLPVATPAEELTAEEAIEQTHAAVTVERLRGHVAAKTLHLTWKPVGPGYTYKVYRSAGGAAPMEIGTTATTEFKDQDVVPGTVYTYAVTAVDPVFEAESAIAETVSLELRR